MVDAAQLLLLRLPRVATLVDNISYAARICVSQEGCMLDPRKTAFTILMALLLLCSAVVAHSQSPTRSSTKHATEKPEISRRHAENGADTWVQEFNAVTRTSSRLLPPEASSCAGRYRARYDSILAELRHSITGGAHSYISTAADGALRRSRYDTGATTSLPRPRGGRQLPALGKGISGQ